MKKIRVMIVEDSAVVTALLEYCIGRDPRLEVSATAASAEEALGMLERGLPDVIAPDVIAMDIRLPGMDGLEATRRIMSRNPVPIVVVATCMESGKWNTIPMEALRAGALTVLEKPAGTTNADYQRVAERLCTQLVIMSQVKLVRRNGHYESPAADGWTPQAWSGPPLVFKPGRFQMLGITCSTGGPQALVQLLGALGPAFPLPILLVQHMTASFIPGFAAWLESVCPFLARVINDGCIPVAGTVHMAPADRHLRLDSGRLRLEAGDPISFQCPSGTVLFESMARDLGAAALGILLTGMGDDGALGLLAIRRAGGHTIAEDESTAVVYGMPAAAVRMEAVSESLPLGAIAARVLELAPAKQALLRHEAH
jgi:two-component system, chemotaxis family, protein-glutamate methylesterase/glutaminase